MITENFILENKDKWEEYKEEINELDTKMLRDLIIEDPDIISIIELDKLYAWHISHILINHPRLIKDLKPYLHKLNEGGIYLILKTHPGLIKDLKPYLDKLDTDGIFYILISQPGLIKDLKPYLHKLNGQDISYISGERPELSLFFKYVGTEHQDAAYCCAFPSEISKLDEEEKQELSKKLAELIRKEKK